MLPGAPSQVLTPVGCSQQAVGVLSSKLDDLQMDDLRSLFKNY